MTISMSHQNVYDDDEDDDDSNNIDMIMADEANWARVKEERGNTTIINIIKLPQ